MTYRIHLGVITQHKNPSITSDLQHGRHFITHIRRRNSRYPNECHENFFQNMTSVSRQGIGFQWLRSRIILLFPKHVYSASWNGASMMWIACRSTIFKTWHLFRVMEWSFVNVDHILLFSKYDVCFASWNRVSMTWIVCHPTLSMTNARCHGWSFDHIN